MTTTLEDQYKNVRQASLDMVKPLEKEDFIPQAAMFASPPKWNLGHTTWFFEEMILSKFNSQFRLGAYFVSLSQFDLRVKQEVIQMYR